MRILILTVTAGHGHNTSARAIEESFHAQGADAVVLDMYKHISSILYNVVDKGYLLSLRHFPRQFGHAYSTAERPIPSKILSVLNSNRLLASLLAGFFRDYKPDLILTTHVFAAQVLDVLKQQGHLDVPIMGVMTDYCIHPFWEAVPSVDYIVTANELTHFAAIRRGIAKERLLPFGIPVSARFTRRGCKRAARQKLGLPEDKTTLLLMGGSMGYGDMPHNVIQIDAMGEDYQLACITGKNERLGKELRELTTKNPLHVSGYTNQVDVYMDAADCIVTKPGGLTTTESLAKGLPMILSHPIPGPELRNANFLTNSGAAVLVSKHFPIQDAVYAVLGRPGRLALMHQAIAHIARPRAADEISRFASELVQQGIGV
ncbi:MAG: galactosyldiacylglycerol synthase [Oscillospiraceae bacterium]|nr:galactosyldiacylglycerol synthase [Oscillospiraceae bacterium]